MGVGGVVEKETVGLIALDAISGVMLVKALGTAARTTLQKCFPEDEL